MTSSWPIQDHSNSSVASDIVRLSEAVEEVARQQHRITLLRLLNLVFDWVIVLLLLVLLLS